MEKIIILLSLVLAVAAICGNDQFLLKENYSSEGQKRKIENAPTHLDVEQKGCPWIVNGKVFSSDIVGLHEEILAFSNYIKPTPIEYEAKTSFLNEISKIVYTFWPFATLEIHGSFAYGFFLPMSDIDVVVNGKWRDGELPWFTMETALIEKHLAVPGTLKVNGLRSLTTKREFVTLTDTFTNNKIDITFDSSYVKSKVEHIQLFSKLYPSFQHLVFVLKQFLSQHGLLEEKTGGINSYALILMTISFLQMHPQSNIGQPHSNLGVLLIEFFELYGRNFNYNTTAIQIRQGGKYIPKNEFQSQMRIIRNDQSYSSNLLTIEDPFDQTIDVGSRFWGVQRIKDEFELAYVVLTQEVYSSKKMNASDVISVLGRIIHITDDVIEYRKWIHDKFFVQSVGLMTPKYFCSI